MKRVLIAVPLFIVIAVVALFGMTLLVDQQNGSAPDTQADTSTRVVESVSSNTATQTASPEPSETQVAKTTPTAPVETLTPIHTPAPETATPQPPTVSINGDINIRGGPGTNYLVLGVAQSGQKHVIIGKNSLVDWWQIDYNGRPGWVYAPLVNSINGELVLVVTPPPTYTPAPPTPTLVLPTDTRVPDTSTSINGINITPENRCSPYDSDDYSYPQSVEPQIIAQMGGIVYSPYTGQYFRDRGETDIEHIVARSEAHDSGLCGRDVQARRSFARDLLNLTLADPSLNRHQKSAKDLAEWLPHLNQCWFVKRVIDVKKKYNLSMDTREAEAARRVLANCPSFEMVVSARTESVSPPTATSVPVVAPVQTNWLAKCDSNNNRRITCPEAAACGISHPVPSSHPAYQHMRDGDGDGQVCE